VNADSIARWYRWIEYAAFGRALERYRFRYLDRLSSARRILILGEGDGRVLSRLLPLAPFARIDVVDSSPQMVELAGRRITHQHQHRVKFHCQDVFERTWGASEFDAVVTCFFLDCFTEVQARRVIRRIARALAPGGIWLVSEFAIPEKGWRCHRRCKNPHSAG
jgi:ubiquinone/menaquinone biosynthesis C-methylase UbiE